VSIDHKVSNPSEVDRIRYFIFKVEVREEQLSREEWQGNWLSQEL